MVQGLEPMTQATDREQREAIDRASRLMESVQAVLARHPDADPDSVRHTLILLGQPPIERLRRSLIRGRSSPQRS